jgi:hypothetical protein
LAALRRILFSRAADTYMVASIEELGTVCACKVTGPATGPGSSPTPPHHHQLREQGAAIIHA